MMQETPSLSESADLINDTFSILLGRLFGGKIVPNKYLDQGIKQGIQYPLKKGMEEGTNKLKQ